jgi:hypothetical protein
MADDKNKLDSKEIEELRKLIQLLQKEISELDFKKLIESGGSARTLLDSLRKEAKELNDDFNDASFNFKKIVQEIKNSDEGFKSASKSFNKLSEIAEKVKYHQSGISKLSSDEIKNLQKQVAQEKQRLADSSKFLNNKTSKLQKISSELDSEIQKLTNQDFLLDKEYDRLGSLLNRQEKINKELSKTEAIHKQVNAAINDEDKSFQALDKTLGNINKQTEDENKKLAGTKGLIAGVNEIPFLRGITDTNKMLDAANAKIAAGGSGTQALGAAFKNLGGQIKGNLINPVTIVVFLVQQLIEALKIADTSTGDLAKQFDLTYQGASSVRRELNSIANESMDTAVTTKGLQESMVAIGKSLGVNAQLNKEDLITFTKLREQAGFTNDELIGIQRTTLATGGSLEDNAKSFMGTVAKMNAQNKLAINAKQLLKEVANVSDAIKLSVGGTATKLAEAAFKAKQFGINLEQADKISQSLLDFENSINNEISAELITGKDLNFEKARLLAINGDIAGASAEILKQVGGTAEFTKMNRIQQEAIAKAAGMTRDELAKSLVDREAAQKLGAKEGQSAQDRYNELVKQYGVEKASAMLGDEALANQFKQQSVQERFTAAIEKLKEVFISLADPLMAVFDIFALILKPVGAIAGIIGMVVGGPLKTMIDGVTKIFGLFTGSTKELGFWEATLGSIAIIVGAIKTYQFAIAGYEKLAAFYAGVKAAAEKQGLISLAAQIGRQAILTASKIAAAVAEITGMSAATLGVAAGIALAAGAAAWAFLGSKKGNDVVSQGYGKRTLMGPEGKIALNDKDTVIAGTNLFPKEKSSSPSISPPPSPAIAAATAVTAATTTNKQDNKDIVNELKAIKSEQSKANSKPTVIENNMNGTNFGTAVAMSTYKTQ